MALDKLNRTIKRTILLFVDSIATLGALGLADAFVHLFAHVTWLQFFVSYAIVMLVYLLIAFKLNIFSILNRYTDYSVLFKIAVAISFAFLFLTVSSILVFSNISYRFLLLSWLFAIPALIIPRLAWRMLSEKSSYKEKNTKKVRTLVVGAGSGGEFFVRTVLNGHSDIDIVGIIDDNPNLQGMYIHGIKVVGTRHDIVRLVQNYEIAQITIAIPSLSGKDREAILEICNGINVSVNSMPSLDSIISGKLSTKNLEKIDLADLLGRKEVVLDQGALRDYFKGETVLVTGAGGSIGSEICRQVCRFLPKRLLLLGHGENSIYAIHRELKESYQQKIDIIPIIADIQDRALMFELMKRYHPDVIYHAAAHKHVPLMEYNPKEAVKNNIFGTKNVAEAAKWAKVKKFVMISTDKAVNPPNVMGATKRIAEMIITGMNEGGSTSFVAVRFGNVLGSRGSVVPLFREQVAKGGPLTVTDFRMTRYFMTIPEASRLVIQASYQAQGGEVFVLDMGEPVKIVDLVQKIIKLSGYRLDEIGIIETGIRPGEKLYEELLSSNERVNERIHEKIFIGKVTPKPLAEVENFIATLLEDDEASLKAKLIAFAKQE